jgi:hypothetical protein
MPLSAGLAIVLFVLWVGFAFVLQIPSGWIHLLLVAAVLLGARAIVDADASKHENAA